MNCLNCGLPLEGTLVTHEHDCVELLRSKLKEATGIIKDLRRGGQHEGACDNEDAGGYDSCSLHVEASKERDRRADAFLKTFEPKPCPSAYTHTSLGRIVCEKDEDHLHRRGDVEHQNGQTKWMSV